jgi:twitching motility protein PilI
MPPSVTSDRNSAGSTTQETLREYQQQLAERTLSARHATSVAPRQLGFVAADQGWLIDIRDATEIMPMPAMTKVPNTQAWFLGLFNHRGTLAGVVDFETFLGQVPRPVQPTDKLIVLSEKFSFGCALRVPEVCGLMSVAGSEAPAAVSMLPAWAGPSWSHEGRQWHALNLRLLLADSALKNAACS